MTDDRLPDASAFLASIVENSNDAIVGKLLDGTIVSWNSAAERIFGFSAEEIVGRSIRDLIPDNKQSEEDRILAAVARGETMPTFETVRRRKDGSLVPLMVTVSPVRDAAGTIIAASKIARDITDRKRVQEKLDDSEHRFSLLADNISQLAWIADSEGWIFWYNRRWFEFTGTNLQEMQGWGWKAVHHPDYVDAVVERVSHCFETGKDWEDTFPLRGADGEYRWFLSRALPIRDEDGKVIYWFGTNTDVTEMRDAEKRIELLLLEVNHRSKNMLAMIQSLARRTAVSGSDFVSTLEKRISGLARNQDLLVSQSWSNVPLRDILETQLEFLGEAVGQVSLEGPAVSLSPGAAEAIAMALHEMATNALKYGGLSEEGGSVRIEWNIVEAEGETPDFVMSWCETGGPPVSQPERTGFGSRIIADFPRTKLRGDVKLEYPASGFRWTLRCPLPNIAD
ncbi:hypothetical protein GCM10011371_23870 [Novosphingobium marinum]|uniref:histidine kinase n=1 Tax=Novosphingobium marinum TaxID=1514948 RepID=A0A7Z0BWQ1_9SPHN|nr:PAS domain S-box protein [Novosphingobium marinum]NYH96502.1 PAS domain S-box-containing protein [Novosphingobium marinum]GGC35725.1 hypothetical protein GCM10011371_23870 [Novosphingobium marinum]